MTSRSWLLIGALGMVLSHGAAPAARQGAATHAGSRGRLDEVLGVEAAPGAFIVSVDAGTPADQLGLDVCNLIAGLNGEDFRAYGDPASFVAAMREAAMSSGADLDVWKSSDEGGTYQRTRTLVQIQRRPGATIGASVSLQVLIVGLVKGGPAERAGVRIGEFIDRVEGRQVMDMHSIAEVDRKIAAAAARGRGVRLTLSRWKPVRGSADFKTSYTTRDVLVGR